MRDARNAKQGQKWKEMYLQIDIIHNQVGIGNSHKPMGAGRPRASRQEHKKALGAEGGVLLQGGIKLDSA
jgi:hypothetical protein